VYKHVREVWTGLVLTVVFTSITGVIAIIDPWDNGVPWANWLTISVVTTLCVGVTTVSAVFAVENTDEDYYWGMPLVVLGLWTMIAGFTVGIATTTKDGLDPRYHSLAWTIFAVPYLAMPLSALVQYLSAASAHNRANETKNHIRRVA